MTDAFLSHLQFTILSLSVAYRPTGCSECD